MSRRCALAISLITALGLLAAQGSARAADPLFCEGYAKDASKSVKLAIHLNCGFQGPRWIKDPNAHKFWCLIADQKTAQGETDARATELKACTCQWYADQTMVQIATNIAKKCGFTGLRWLDDKKAHHDWCANFNPSLDAMMNEIEIRKTMLKGC
jgi:hypothetical protein